jgi:hypothetical protein
MSEAKKLFGRKLAESTPNEGGIYWLPGRYLVEIDTVKLFESRKGKDLFIVVGKNIESDNEERPIGSKPSWVVSLDQDAAPGNIKGFFAAVLGVNHTDLGDDDWQKVWSRATDEDNPLCGFVAKLECVMIKTRAGNDFTKHTWTAHDELPENAQEFLASL